MSVVTQERLCPLGRLIETGSYSCYFCSAWPLHRGDSGCGCSQQRLATTYGATLCNDCAEALDILTAATLVGKIHKRLVHDAEMRYMRGSDD
jgi:hypothetical protein